MNAVRPDWSITGVRALTTTRTAGDAADTDQAALALACPGELPSTPCWLRQVHGARVVHLDDWHDGIEADAAWTDRPGRVAVIRTADCLPVVLADGRARVVAAVHAGWRGLAAGILGETLAALPVPGEALQAWIGPGICGNCYQVGDEVRQAFLSRNPGLESAFFEDGERWRADLKAIARLELTDHHVEVRDSGQCTYEQPERFYSHRRNAGTGRLITAIWIDARGRS